MRPSFTIGIEEEYQTIDPETRDLRSHLSSEILEQGKLLLQQCIAEGQVTQRWHRREQQRQSLHSAA